MNLGWFAFVGLGMGSSPMFADFGDVFSPVYNDGNSGAFWDGFNGITSTDPNLGIAPNFDGRGFDDLFLVGTSPLTAGPGSFTLTIPMNTDPSDFTTKVRT